MSQRQVIIPNSVSPSDQQKESIIIKMETHKILAKKQITKLGPLGSDKHKIMWSEFTQTLNAMGPAIKTETQWQAYWTSMRLSAKNEMATCMYKARQTGTNDCDPPSEEVLRISKIFGSYGIGSSIIPEVGIYAHSSNEENPDEGELFYALLESHENVLHQITLYASHYEAIEKVITVWVDKFSKVIENFLNHAVQWMTSIYESRLAMSATKAQIAALLKKLNGKVELANGLVDYEEASVEWISIKEVLDYLGPAYDIDFWMAYWQQLVVDTVEKKSRVEKKLSRARLSELDQDVLNIVEGNKGELLSLKNINKAKPLTTAGFKFSQTASTSHTNHDEPSTSKSHFSKPAFPPLMSSTTSTLRQAQPRHADADKTKPKSTPRPTTTGMQQQSIDKLQEGNEIMLRMIGHLEECLQKHTTVLGAALNQFNTSIEKLTDQIIESFLSNRRANPVHPQNVPNVKEENDRADITYILVDDTEDNMERNIDDDELKK